MAVTNLTDRRVQALEAGKHQTDFWDRSLPGFGVRVAPSGRKSFVVMYYAPGGKRRMTLGAYPGLGLADARQRAREILFDASQGNDPQAQRLAYKQAETFAELADEYIERHAKVKKRSWREDERIIAREMRPIWKGRKAVDIKRRDVILLLDRVVERGAPIMANRVRALISKMYNFGLGRDIVEHNPTMGVPRPGKEGRRDRVLAEREIRAMWAALDDIDSPIADTFKMRLLTAQRGIEVLSMRWQDIDGDWWTIPGDVAKNGLSHRVPLAPQVLTLLSEIRTLDRDGPWVFPSPTRKGAHIAAVTHFAHRIRKVADIHFVPHDLRRTAASLMTSMGISRLVVSKILNHAESGVTAVYDRYSYDSEKRQALVRWAGRLDEILGQDPKNNVVRIA